MKRSLFNVFLVMILSMVYVKASAAGLEGISAYSSGGAIMQTNDLINSGSQLNWSFSNNSNVNVTLVSMQLIDGVTNMEGNLMSVNEFVGAGSTVSYTTTIGILGIHVPVTCRFKYSYDGKEYYIDAVYKESYSPDPTSNIKLTIMATGNGTVTYNGSSIRNGEESFNIRFFGDASISFTPDYGYRIKYVKVNNSDVTSRLSNNQYRISLIMDNTTVQVEFEAIPTNYFTLKYMVDGVTYKTYQLQVGATITPEPWPTKDGYSFSGWSEIPRTMPDHDVIITGTFTLLPISNSSGSCGETVNYSYEKATQTLTISGRGAIYDYDNGSNKAPWYSYADEIQNIKIESGITSIGYFAFYKCSKVKSLNLPATVGYIGSSAFEDCTSLTSLSLSEGLLDIGGSAFEGCTALKTLTIPSTVNTISINAFKNCKGITDVYCYAENVPDTHFDAFDATPTENSTLHVPANSVETYRTSWPWSDFKEIVPIGGGTTTLTDNGIIFALKGDGTLEVTGLESWQRTVDILSDVTINGRTYRVTSIAAYAFQGRSDIRYLSIPWSVTSIGEYAFRDCGSNISVNIADPESWCQMQLGNEHASPLSSAGKVLVHDIETTRIDIPATVTAIGKFTFYQCRKINSLNIPSSVKSIGSSAFEDCTGLTALTLSEGLETIGGSAFQGCTGLQTLIIPSTVKSININAIANCSGIREVYCYAENVPDTHADAFDATPTENATLHVPANALRAYRRSWPWSDFKDIVAIGEDPDAIKGIKQSDDSKTEYYDLTGRKVYQPQKGLYIKNGKKVVVK